MRYCAKYSGAFSDKPVGLCDVCLCEVYGGDEVYVIDGFIICTDCFGDYMKDMYKNCKILGEEIEK